MILREILLSISGRLIFGCIHKVVERVNSGTRENEPRMTNSNEASSSEMIATQISDFALVVQNYEVGQIIFENRAWWFAVNDGFEAEIGDSISVQGFYE